LKTGIDFDLPSEAQWEFAARAGHGSGYWNDGSVVLNVSSDSNLNRLGHNVNNNPGSTSTTATLAPSEGGTAIVGSYEPSSWGLYDMHGNVFEWCLDWYQVNISTATDSQGELYAGHVNIKPDQPTVTLSGATASQRVLRGGSWNYGSALGRPAMRFADGAAHRYSITGLRVVCTAGLQ
jgi:formylglycine-generating enzyme required for sulfatase activity